jgi:hypothetical protein
MGATRAKRFSSMSTAAPWWKRLAWMAAIWAASVALLGLVSLALRLWLKAAA